MPPSTAAWLLGNPACVGWGFPVGLSGHCSINSYARVNQMPGQRLCDRSRPQYSIALPKGCCPAQVCLHGQQDCVSKHLMLAANTRSLMAAAHHKALLMIKAQLLLQSISGHAMQATPTKAKADAGCSSGSQAQQRSRNDAGNGLRSEDTQQQ